MLSIDLQLAAINYKQYEDNRELAGIQLAFRNGFETPWYETSLARPYAWIEKTIEINNRPPISSLSMKFSSQDGFAGIQILD